MSLVVADTTPINYLILCDAVHVLPQLYERLVIPTAVHAELQHERTPGIVKAWIHSLPEWVAIKGPASPIALPNLGLGEREAIALAKELKADVILMDERLAREVASQNGLKVTGTLGVLEHAAERNLLDLTVCFDRLRRTNFHCEEGLLQSALARVANRNR